MPRELLKRALPKLRSLQFANDSAVERLNALIEDIEAELARPDQEPLGYMRDDGDGWYEFSNHDDEGSFPVYANPLRLQEPLSEDAIKACLQDAVRLPPGWLDFARAIERAHGIGVDNV